jgi:hypothetical protein
MAHAEIEDISSVKCRCAFNCANHLYHHQTSVCGVCRVRLATSLHKPRTGKLHRSNLLPNNVFYLDISSMTTDSSPVTFDIYSSSFHVAHLQNDTARRFTQKETPRWEYGPTSDITTPTPHSRWISRRRQSKDTSDRTNAGLETRSYQYQSKPRNQRNLLITTLDII